MIIQNALLKSKQVKKSPGVYKIIFGHLLGVMKFSNYIIVITRQEALIDAELSLTMNRQC